MKKWNRLLNIAESVYTSEYMEVISSVAQLCSTLQNPVDCRTASLSITNTRSLFKLMSIESVTASNHLILCHPLLLLPSIFPLIRLYSNESVLCIRWPKYWSFSFSISPSNEYSGLFPLGWTGWISLQSKGFSRVFSTPQFKCNNSSWVILRYIFTSGSLRNSFLVQRLLS